MLRCALRRATRRRLLASIPLWQKPQRLPMAYEPCGANSVISVSIRIEVDRDCPGMFRPRRTSTHPASIIHTVENIDPRFFLLFGRGVNLVETLKDATERTSKLP